MESKNGERLQVKITSKGCWPKLNTKHCTIDYWKNKEAIMCHFVKKTHSLNPFTGCQGQAHFKWNGMELLFLLEWTMSNFPID